MAPKSSAPPDTQVTTVVEEGLASATDDELANVCRSDRKCLVTLDLDFSNPLRFAPSRHSGIAVLRLPHRSTADDLFHAVRTLASGLAASTIDGKTAKPFGLCWTANPA